MNLKRWLPFLAAGFMGVIAVTLMMNYVGTKERELAKLRAELLKNFQSPIEVLVAKRDIPKETIIKAEDLSVLKVPKQFVQPYATTHANDLIGLMAAVEIAQGEQILRNKLRRPSEMVSEATSLSELTSEGMRAITIGSDALSGVGGFVRPGDHVDIVWTHAGRSGEEAVTLLLFQHVRVLAVGNQMVGGEPSEGAAAGGNYTVTVELTPQQAELLLFAREQGHIQLSLRSPKEKPEALAIAPVNVSTFMQAVLGRPAAEERPQHVVEVFKGLERSVVSINE